jgi:hypothetical protein
MKYLKKIYSGEWIKGKEGECHRQIKERNTGWE